MKKIKCAFIASYYGPYFGNFVASMLAFDKEMKRRGHSVVYILPEETRKFSWADKLLEENRKVYFIPYKPNTIGDIVRIHHIFALEQVTLIYSRMCGWDFSSHFAAPDLPIVWHMDMRVDIVDKIRRMKNWLKFKILAFGKTYHVAVSYPVGNAINTLKPRNKCVVIPNAIDIERIIPKKGTPENEIKNILLFGWDPMVKGLDLAIKAVTEANQREERFRLLVSAQEKTYSYIEDVYKNSEKPKWLELIPPTDDISSLYQKADIMLSASRTESFSYCMAEALLAGLPIVYSDIPGTSWADEFCEVYKFSSGSEQDLIRAINECSVRKRDNQFQVINRKHIIQQYSMDSWAKRVVEYVEEIMAESY